MSRRNVEDLYPLSPLQQGLLFHSIDAPGSGVYVEQLSCTLRGELDLNAFQRAWQQTVDRHPILRTAFIWEGVAEPVQVVRQRVSLPFTKADWRKLTTTEQDENLRTYLKADLGRGFDLSKAPLLRIALLRLTDDSYKFVWSYHHLMLDGWGIPLLLKEVFAFYDAFAQGQSLSLDRPRPYRDYIAWLQQQDISQAAAFWRQTLKGFTAPTPLTVDRLSEREASEVDQRGEQHDGYRDQQLSLPEETTATLLAVTRRHQLTLNTIVQGAWALLLSRYSGEQDVVFGVTVAGRPAELSGVESMIGLFINTLPVRVKVDRGQAVAPWLKQLQVQQSELRQYEYSPLVQVQGWSEVPRGLPLFESLLVFENYPVDASFRQQLQRLSISDLQKVERTNYPLTLLALPGTELLLQISYDSHRFDDATVKRMLGHLRTMLEAIAANSSQRVADLPLLTSAEERQLLSEWNPSFESDSPSVCLHQMFEAQVKRTPHAVAVVFEDQRLTYAELNRRANQLAHYLRGMGVGAETLVAMCVERSLEMVVAILGILKAGGAYVPLDPAYPKERLAFMLEDTQAQFLLTQQSLAETLPDYAGPRVERRVLLDTDWPAIAKASEENPPNAATADTLAYVIYTSGSTGRPKGTLVSHHNVARLFEATQASFQFDEHDVWTLFHSYAFDFSVWELWGALLYGGRLVIVPYWVARSAEAFHRLLGSEQVTVLNQTPSAFRQLMRVAEASQTQDLKLRLVIFGGEALELQSLKPWFAKHGDRVPRLVNMFGITETTVHVTYRPLAQADLDLAQSNLVGSVIGRPLSCLQVYLLDQRGQLVPVGVPGEICVGGSGVTRGYLNRAELTAERFMPHPFSEAAGARLYRSGDLGRYVGQGDIEYLGRLDNQVKVRGFRIELGEIESALAEHPAVRECTVIARDDTPGETKLVAYLVAGGQPVPSTTDLRDFLHDKLPEHMIPSAFVDLDALPLTPNGKIDRRALPATDQARPQLGQGFVAPRTPVEQELAAIWQELLGVAEVGIYDDFFELGGHSLLLTQLASWVRRDFQVEVPLRVLFDTPTIIEMTKAILARQVEQENQTDLAEMLGQLKQLSPHEVQAMLEKMSGAR